MALVDYSSSDSAEDETDSQQPPTKRRKAHSSDVATSGEDGHGSSGTDAEVKKATPGLSNLPPLPLAFHDLYASTVRQSTIDDPSLHHGRRRQTPHVVGNWPTHLYVEWHPTDTQNRVLSMLIDDIQKQLPEAKLYNFLTSDLGAPLPLHISLSRPLSLPTEDKDTFLEKVIHGLHASAIDPFAVHPQDLFWFKSPDSNRSFLVLRVSSCPKDEGHLNPELLSLLRRCNDIARTFDQPILYQSGKAEAAGNAFHVSIGWTFDHPSDSAAIETLQLFDQDKFALIQTWKIEVTGVKAKIGNVVHHIALDGPGRSATTLFES